MKEKDFTAKNAKIKEAIAQTRAKRKSQQCKVFDLKIVENKLSKRQLEDLKMQFVESKWLYNDMLAWCKEDPLNKPSNYKIRDIVKVKNKDGQFEERKLEHLSVQARQALQVQMISSIKTLSTLKKKGYKIGPLKFKANYNVLHLKQFKTMYSFKGGNWMKIQGIYRLVYVKGLHQIPVNAEFANAKLLNAPDGYHLKVTVFLPKEEIVHNGKEVGIDFGCSTAFTLSTGEKINCSIGETERLKRLQRKLEFLKKGSNNRRKLIKAIQKEYLKINNRKNDAANKIVHRLLNEFSLVAIQDEQLNAWKENHHGKAVQHSVLGRVKAKLKQSPKVYVCSKWEATTKTCSNCGHKQEMSEKIRVYDCPKCGLHLDRDVNAAINILKVVPMERREVKACSTQEAATLFSVKKSCGSSPGAFR